MKLEDVFYNPQVDPGFFRMTPDSSTNMSINGFAVRHAARILKQQILKAAASPIAETQRGKFPSVFPGAKAEDLYDLALGIVEKAGLSEGFMGYPEPVSFVGHGLGLELDEWPILGKHSDHILEAGMMIAMEPKTIFPGEGVVGIENTFVVTEEGMEKLNHFPDEIVVLPR